MGYYVLKWGGGQYQSVEWCLREVDADAKCKQIKDSGQWSGMPPKVVPAW